MNVSELKKKLIVDDQTIKADLEQLVDQLSQVCVIDQSGRVHFKKRGLQGKSKVKLVLSTRCVANELEQNIAGTVSTDEVGEMTGLPANQARARLAELAKEGFATQEHRGVYKANPFRVREFIMEVVQS